MHRWALFALVTLAPCVSQAHGGPPSFENLAVDPSDAMHVLVGTNFGLLSTHDGGATWSWICPEAIELHPSVENPAVAISDDGSGFVALQSGLWRASSTDCDWSIAESMFDRVEIGVVARGGPSTLFVGTSADGHNDALYRSTDSDPTFAPVLGPNAGVWYESVRVAPSRSQRVYAVQNRPPLSTEPWQTSLFRSDDNGDSWTELPFTLLTHEWRLFVLAVDPLNPDRLLAKTQDLYPGEHERLLLSEDAGATFREVLELTVVQDAAWSSDGATVWTGGPVDGLLRSDDHGATFIPVQAHLEVRCIVTRPDGELWICGNDYSNGFGVGRSINGGATFEPLVRLIDIGGILQCDAATAVGSTCPMFQSELDTALRFAPGSDAGTIIADAGPDAGPMMMDAGLDAGVSPPRSSCAIGPRAMTRTPSWMILALVIARPWRKARGRSNDALREES